MTWIETLSPNLLCYLNAWINLRGPKKVPGLESFPEFEKILRLDFAAIVDVSEKRECTFSRLGQNMAAINPGCGKGTRFAHLNHVALRLAISRPINEVIATRRPTTRRSTYRTSDGDAFFEQLYLPFIDKNFEVRQLTIVGDGYGLARNVS